LANRTGKGGFVKGQSGNPGGIPRAIRLLSPEEVNRQRQEAANAVREATIAARLATPKAIAKLEYLADHGSPQLQSAATCALLDRGLGRAPVAVELSIDKFRSWSLDDVRAFREKYIGIQLPAIAPVIEIKSTPVADTASANNG